MPNACNVDLRKSHQIQTKIFSLRVNITSLTYTYFGVRFIVCHVTCYYSALDRQVNKQKLVLKYGMMEYIPSIVYEYCQTLISNCISKRAPSMVMIGTLVHYNNTTENFPKKIFRLSFICNNNIAIISFCVWMGVFYLCYVYNL